MKLPSLSHVCHPSIVWLPAEASQKVHPTHQSCVCRNPCNFRRNEHFHFWGLQIQFHHWKFSEPQIVSLSDQFVTKNNPLSTNTSTTTRFIVFTTIPVLANLDASSLMSSSPPSPLPPSPHHHHHLLLLPLLIDNIIINTCQRQNFLSRVLLTILP